MSRAAPVQDNFNGGELSPLLRGRGTLAKYGTGCQKLENMIPVVQGPGKRRGGLRMVSEVKDSGERCWFGRFKFSKSQSYVLEFGPLYIRFYADRGRLAVAGTPVEIVTPYTAGDLTTADGTFGLDTEQSGDIIYVACPTRPPQVIVRAGPTDWSIAPYVTKNGPLLDQNPDKTLRLYTSARTGSVTVTASANVFTNQHVGAFLRIDLEDILLPPWEPQKSIPVDALYRSDGKTYQAKNADGTRVTGTKTPIHEEGTVLDGSGVTTETVPRTIGIEWEFRDPGYGYGRITAVSSPTVCTVAVEADSPYPDGVIGSGNPTNAWQLGAWGPHNEYPGQVAFWKDRLGWFGRRRFWLSVPADYNNYTRDIVGQVRADCAITRELQTTQTIQWVSAGTELLIGTESAEWIVAKQTISEPLGPNNIDADAVSAYGARNLKSLAVAKSVLFAQANGRVVREATTDDQGNYQAPDMTILAEHITRSGVIAWTWAQQPDKTLWAVRADGVLLGATVEKEQDVAGWHRHPTQGLVEDVTSIPSPDGTRDDVWCIVRRNIGGTWRRFIEVMDQGDADDGDQTDCFYVDCGLTYSGPPATTISGIDHLAGMQVDVLVNGAAHPPRTVSNVGTIQLREQGTRVHVGLPMRAVIVPMPIEAGAQLGTAQGKIKRIDKVGLRFYRTLGCKVGPSLDKLSPIPFRRGSDPLGSPPALFTGLHEIDFEGDYEQDGTVFIVQDQPLPMTLCAVLPEMVTHERS